MGRRVHQRLDDLQKLEDRSRPAMGEYNWQGALVLRSDVNEVNSETVNLRAKLWQPIQRALNTTPVVAGAPVFSERLRFVQRRSLRPIGYRFLVRPAGVGKSVLEIVECCLRYMNLEGFYILRRLGEHEPCSFVIAPMGTYWHEPRGQ